MKKTLLTVFAVALVTSMCFVKQAAAQSSANNSTNQIQAPGNVVITTSMAGSPAPASSSGTTTFTGKVATC